MLHGEEHDKTKQETKTDEVKDDRGFRELTDEEEKQVSGGGTTERRGGRLNW